MGAAYVNLGPDIYAIVRGTIRWLCDRGEPEPEQEPEAPTAACRRCGSAGPYDRFGLYGEHAAQCWAFCDACVKVIVDRPMPIGADRDKVVLYLMGRPVYDRDVGGEF